MICLDLYGEPIAKKRPRFRRMGKFVSTYDAQEKLKEGYQWQVKALYRDPPLLCPILLDVCFHMPIPKSTSGIRRKQMLAGLIYHIKRPDLDNLVKFLDYLNGIIFADDSQIVELRAKKIYSSNPGTVIRIKTLEELNSETNIEDSTRSCRRGTLHRLDP